MFGDTWRERCSTLVNPVLLRLMNATAFKVTVAYGISLYPDGHYGNFPNQIQIWVIWNHIEHF